MDAGADMLSRSAYVELWLSTFLQSVNCGHWKGETSHAWFSGDEYLV
jgi:hypothetical protein